MNFIVWGETGAILTAVDTGSPFNAATIPCATSTETPTWASTVEAPKWGVKVTPGRPINGWFGSIGSLSNTSIAAPATWPDLTASAKSCSLMIPPRAQFIKRTPFFILAILSLLSMPFVFGVSGICTVIKSDCLINSSRETTLMPKEWARSSLTYGS